MARNFRLMGYLVLTAVCFPPGRLFALTGLSLAVIYHIYRWGESRYRKGLHYACLAAVTLVLLGSWCLWQRDSGGFDWKDQPPPLATVADGRYQGEATGKRGLIKVEVTVSDHQITAINVLEQQETASIGVPAIEQVTSKILAGQQVSIDGVSGATLSSNGVKEAIAKALWSGSSEQPPVSWLALLATRIASSNLNRETFNTLAILLIIFLLFDYCIQNIITKNTGQTLNCLNCQTCVAACPIKSVNDLPYPMTMVLDTRLGNYERVMELAGYCVGCSKCAGKCPVGISPPYAAGTAIAEFYRQIKKIG